MTAYIDAQQLDDIGLEPTHRLLPRCSPRRCACGSILSVVVLGLGVIFPLSWQTLPYSEMGLDFNQISGKLDTSRAYERGRHLVGLGHVFITFPRTIQTIDFAQASELETETSLTSIPVISADGQMVRLECSVWYRLVPDRLGELYSRYATRYASNIAKAARQGITEASSLFDTVDFYQSRARVRQAMKLAVAAELASYPVEFVDVWLWKCEVPSRLDEAIVNKLVTEQLKRTMLNRQAATLIAEQTSSLVARTAVSEQGLLHAARAEATLQVAAAEVSGLAATTGTAVWLQSPTPPIRRGSALVTWSHPSSMSASTWAWLLRRRRTRLAALGGSTLSGGDVGGGVGGVHWAPSHRLGCSSSPPPSRQFAFDHPGALAHGMGEMADGLGWGGRQALHWLWWDTARSAALRYIKPTSRATSGAS